MKGFDRLIWLQPQEDESIYLNTQRHKVQNGTINKNILKSPKAVVEGNGRFRVSNSKTSFSLVKYELVKFLNKSEYLENYNRISPTRIDNMEHVNTFQEPNLPPF